MSKKNLKRITFKERIKYFKDYFFPFIALILILIIKMCQGFHLFQFFFFTANFPSRKSLKFIKFVLKLKVSGEKMTINSI